MSFLKAGTTFTRFKIIDEIPPALWGEIPDKLRKHAFKDIDDIPEERSWGWVNFEDMLDVEWKSSPPQKGEYLTFSLRLDTRRVPPAVIKKHLAVEMKKEEAQNKERGKNYISRERKKELKELVILRLKQRFLPIPAEFQAVWNTGSNIVYFASTQSKMLDLFQEQFTLSFNLHIEPLSPYNLAASILSEAELDRLDLLEAADFRI